MFLALLILGIKLTSFSKLVDVTNSSKVEKKPFIKFSPGNKRDYFIISFSFQFTLFTINESAEVSLSHGQERVGGDVGGDEATQERFVISLLHQLGEQLENTGEIRLSGEER